MLQFLILPTLSWWQELLYLQWLRKYSPPQNPFLPFSLESLSYVVVEKVFTLYIYLFTLHLTAVLSKKRTTKTKKFQPLYCITVWLPLLNHVLSLTVTSLLFSPRPRYWSSSTLCYIETSVYFGIRPYTFRLGSLPSYTPVFTSIHPSTLVHWKEKSNKTTRGTLISFQ